MKRFKGFTLSELLIAIGVLGILCALILPMIAGTTPNQNKLMMKKAYNIFTNVTKELINDSVHYPVYYGICPDNNTDGYLGFDCGTSNSKLPYLFSAQLTLAKGRIPDENTLKTNSDYSKSGTANCLGTGSSCFVFETNDGIVWVFPKDTFTKGSYTDSILIGVDVNGDRDPNCYQGSNTTECKDKDDNFDQFRIELFADGTVKINSQDEWAKDAVQANSSLK